MKRTRKILLFFLCVFVFLSHLLAQKRSPKNIVVLISSQMPLYNKALHGFEKSLKDKAIAYDSKTYELPALKDNVLDVTNPKIVKLFEKIKKDKPDLVLCLGSLAVRLTRMHAKNTPHVFCMVVDPARFKVFHGGVTLDVRHSEQIDFIRKNFPFIQRIGLIYHPNENKAYMKEAFTLSKKGKTNMVFKQVSSEEELSRAIVVLGRKTDCLLMVPNARLFRRPRQFILQTFHHKLPIISISASYVKAGAMAGAYADYENNGYLAGDLAQRVLNGENYRNLPVLSPTKIKYSLNLVIAERLGFQIMKSTIQSAENVFQ